MTRFIANSFIILVILVWAQIAHAGEYKVTIIEPANNAEVTSPFKVCLKSENLIVEPAKNGVSQGKGHHHLLFSSLPTDLSKPLGKNNVIHMGDGSSCRTIELSTGIHSIRALFADGNHIPYQPYVTDVIFVRVTH
ncbi:MAG: rod shape-determining protein RodA [Nitrospinaceae bacterium]|nr:MAG: rod shape-determining protein RodA [Nitrospinaceae bacterium]